MIDNPWGRCWRVCFAFAFDSAFEIFDGLLQLGGLLTRVQTDGLVGMGLCYVRFALFYLVRTGAVLFNDGGFLRLTIFFSFFF